MVGKKVKYCTNIDAFARICNNSFLKFVLLVSERSERDTIRGVQIRACAVYIYIYICLKVRMP